MPTCQNCRKYVNAVLLIKVPETLRKYSHSKLKGKKKAWFCFSCIRDKARNCLDPNGYWFQFVFPHLMPVHRRFKD